MRSIAISLWQRCARPPRLGYRRPGLATTRRAAGHDQLTNAALAAWFGPADAQVKEKPRAGRGFRSIEEILGRPDSIPKDETRYHPKELRRPIKRSEMHGYSP